MSIKRHPALQPLSRDHLVALFHSYRLIQAANNNPRFNLEESIIGFKSAWKNEIAIHFADEERLFPSLPVSVDSLQRLFDEHAALRQLILELETTGSQSSVLALKLGQTLDAHIRWEEHSLFPEIEQALSEAEIRQLGQDTDRIEKGRVRKGLR